MASSPPRQEHKKSMAIAMTVPQLLTPEEPLAENFAPKAPVRAFQAAVPSPPASPEFNSFSTDSRFQQNDEVLYPDAAAKDNPHAGRPLFDNANPFTTPDRQRTPSTEDSLSVATPSTRQDSPLEKGDELARTRLPASRDESNATPVGPVALNNHYGLDWYRYCRIQNEEYRARKMAQRTLPPPTGGDGRDPYTRRVISSLGRSYRVEKPVATTQTSTRPKASRVTIPKAAAPATGSSSPAAVKHESQTKRGRRQTSTPDASAFSAFSNAVQPKPRTRAAPSKKVDDKGAQDWRQIPDYCPPLDSLDKMSDKLAVQWTNSNELNLSEDPDKDQLHPQELKIASTLRLKCNQYLANKRRIFQARFTALREGKEFNKTSAQTSTNIDVNKASRLWQAFDNVGWFDEHYFQQHL